MAENAGALRPIQGLSASYAKRSSQTLAAPQMDALLFCTSKIKFERPDGSIGEQPGSGTVLMAKGAVAVGAARSVRVLNRMSSEQATRAGISEADRFSYFWIHYGKANHTRMDNSEHWRKLESVALGNGRGLAKPQDFAGVVTEWKWPTKEQIAAEVPSDAKQQVLVKLANQNYRESSQSEDWAGYVLADALGIDCDVTKAMTPEKRKVKAVLDAWLDSGVLSVSAEDDPRHLGRKVKYIRPA